MRDDTGNDKAIVVYTKRHGKSIYAQEDVRNEKAIVVYTRSKRTVPEQSSEHCQLHAVKRIKLSEAAPKVVFHYNYLVLLIQFSNKRLSLHFVCTFFISGHHGV